MIDTSKLIIFFSLILFISCAEEHKKFTDKKPQNMGERIFKDTLVASDSLNLSKVNLYEFMTLNINSNHVFISGRNKIVTISKEDFTNYKTIHFKEGKGPQEILNLQSFDVSDSTMVILDEKQNKVLTYKLPNAFKGEHIVKKLRPHRIRFLNGHSYILFSPMIGSGYLFNLINMKKEDVLPFGKISSKRNPLVYEGSVITQKDDIYYAGFSEPLLKKYSSDGTLLYSVATIDNFNTEANYMGREGSRVITYAPGAQFSTRNFDIVDNYWLVIPYNTFNKPARNLDVYNETNGKYIGTIDGLKPKTFQICADQNFLYAISENKGDYVLTRYKNRIQF